MKPGPDSNQEPAAARGVIQILFARFQDLLLTPGRRQVLGNTAWLSGDRVLRMAAGLFVGTWMARSLGPAQFGLMNFCLAWVAIFSPLSTLGLEGIVVRQLVREPADEGETTATAFFLRLLGGGLAAIIALLSMWAYRGASRDLLVVTALGCGTTLFQSFDVFDFFFQSRLQASVSVLSRGLAFAMATGLRVVLLLAQAPVQAFVAVSALEVLIGGVGLAVSYARRADRQRFTPSVLRARRLLRDSWPLLFSSFMILSYVKINQLMLEALSSVDEVGRFAAASTLSEAWYFIPVAISASVFPSIVALKGGNPALFQARMQALYRTVVSLSAAIALPTSLLASTIIAVLYGPRFTHAGPVLAVQIWTGVFVGLGVARTSFLTAMNWTRFHLLSVGMGSVTSIALNAWLIPRYGALGAAWASLGAYWMAAHGSCLADRDLWPTFGQMSRALARPLPWGWP